MLRLRRYRVFLFFAIVTVLAFYKFSGSTSWQREPAPLDSSSNTANKPPTDLKPQPEIEEADKVLLEQPPKPIKNEVVKETAKIDVHVPAAETPQGPLVTPPPVAPISKPTQVAPPAPVSDSSETADDSKDKAPDRVPQVLPVPGNLPHEQGHLEQSPPSSAVNQVHWKKQKEHFPVSSSDIIELPTGKPKKIPKIQYEFQKETAEQKSSRQAKLDIIKEHFMHSWSGYKKYAWDHDELTPVSGSFKDPFAGWRATLVDALDTLWIMGLEDEFDLAVKAVKEIDFTYTTRQDIPVFETTIRYLGGFLAAYDMSGAKYPILLEKAVELAEILMGAFDTPNRMPFLYYGWRPAFASQPHRAKTDSVLAEIGSLSMEFTRLAQLTKENKYYDAVARITNELELSQNSTKLPGMWPTKLDASGCKKMRSNPIPVDEDVTKLSSDINQPHLEDEVIEIGTPVRGGIATQKDRNGQDESKMIPDEQKFAAFQRPPPLEFKVVDGEEDASSGRQAGKVGRIQGFDGEAIDETVLQNEQVMKPEAPRPVVPPSKPQAGKVGRIHGFDGESVDESILQQPQAPKPDQQEGSYAARAGKVGRIQGFDGEDVDETSLGRFSSGSTTEVEDAAPADSSRKLSKATAEQDWNDDGSPEEIFERLPPGKPGKMAGWPDREEEISGLSKRQLDDSTTELVEQTQPAPVKAPKKVLPGEEPDCEPQGLVSWTKNGKDIFTLGGMSDSTYEYLPKQFLLLGGLETKYREMYEYSMEAIRKHLLFRPMLPNEDDILMSGAYHIDGPAEGADPDGGTLDPEGAHLTCFAGGMIGMSAKIFGIESDLAIAKKLTEGCVWSYKVTETGVMPESFRTLPCDSMKECPWNQTRYYEFFDPRPDLREHAYERQLEIYSSRIEWAKADATAIANQKEFGEDREAIREAARGAKPTPPPKVVEKRQIDDEALPYDSAPQAALDSSIDADVSAQQDESTLTDWERAFKSLSSNLQVPVRPLSHEKTAKQHIEDRRIPPGMVSVDERGYILRPEAIESVWYMYRITGDEHWREVGWQMWEAIALHTRAEYGHSAIDDVTMVPPTQRDSMESFWLAETLKYFYLLFSDESVVSLDEWVLNTEAHPFKRPIPDTS